MKKAFMKSLALILLAAMLGAWLPAGAQAAENTPAAVPERPASTAPLRVDPSQSARVRRPVPDGTQADPREETSGIVLRLNALRSRFPDGLFWNHCANANHESHGYANAYCTSGQCNDPDGYTDTPCTSHDRPVGEGEFGCNLFGDGLQCYGFANKLFYEVFGETTSSLPNRTDIENVQAGDWLRLYNNTHSAIVLSRNGDTLTIAEANINQNCMIMWDREISVQDITYFKHAVGYETVEADLPTAPELEVTLSKAVYYAGDRVEAAVKAVRTQETQANLDSPLSMWVEDRFGNRISGESEGVSGLFAAVSFELPSSGMEKSMYYVVFSKKIDNTYRTGRAGFYFGGEPRNEVDLTTCHIEIELLEDSVAAGDCLEVWARVSDADGMSVQGAPVRLYIILPDNSAFYCEPVMTAANGWCGILVATDDLPVDTPLIALAVIDGTDVAIGKSFIVRGEPDPEDYGVTVAGITVNSANCGDVLGDGGSVVYLPDYRCLIFTDAVITGDIVTEERLILQGNAVIRGRISALMLTVECDTVEVEQFWCNRLFITEGTLKTNVFGSGSELYVMGGRLEGGQQGWEMIELDNGSIECPSLMANDYMILGGSLTADTMEIVMRSAYITNDARVVLNGRVNPYTGIRYCVFSADGGESLIIMDQAEVTLGGPVENLAVIMEGGTVYGSLETRKTMEYAGIVTDITLSGGKVFVDKLAAGGTLSILAGTERIEADCVCAKKIVLDDGLVIREPRGGIVAADPEDGREYISCADGVTKPEHVVIEPGEPGPQSYAIEVVDHTKGRAVISLEANALCSGETRFTVLCDVACVVARVTGEGYEELHCGMTGDVPVFSLVAEADTKLVIALRGDADLDGELNVRDAALTREIAAEVAGLDAWLTDPLLSRLVCDATGDGTCSVRDVTAIRMAAAGVAGFALPWKTVE